MQWGMHLKMNNNQGQHGCLQSCWYGFSLPLRWKYLKKHFQSFRGQNRQFLHFLFNLCLQINNLDKNGDFYPQIIFILMAAKIHTSNFAGCPFGPDYFLSSNASLTATSISTIFQCIFKIFQIIVNFSKLLFFSFLEYSANSKV